MFQNAFHIVCDQNNPVCPLGDKGKWVRCWLFFSRVNLNFISIMCGRQDSGENRTGT